MNRYSVVLTKSAEKELYALPSVAIKNIILSLQSL